jgi:hypothetical protein
MTAARERQAVDGIGLALIRGGAIATRSMLSSGARTAQFLARQDKVALSAIAGRIACNLFILADAVAQAGPNTRIVGVNSATCGVVAMSVPDDDFVIPEFLRRDRKPLPPVTIPNGSDCQKHLNMCLSNAKPMPGNVFGTSQCLTCFDVCKNTGFWPYSTPTGTCRYTGFIDD